MTKTAWTATYLADGGSITAQITFTKRAAAETAYKEMCDMVDANSPAFPAPTAKLSHNGINIAWYSA